MSKDTDILFEKYVRESKYGRDENDWKKLSADAKGNWQIWERIIANNNPSLERHPNSNSEVDFNDGSDAKFSTLTAKKKENGEGYHFTINIASCAKKYGYIRAICINNKTGGVYPLVIDKYFTNEEGHDNNKETLSFSFNKFGAYFTFPLEDVVEKDTAYFDKEFAYRKEQIGRPEVQNRKSKEKSKKSSNTPTCDDIEKAVAEAQMRAYVKGISETSTLSEDELDFLLKKVKKIA